MALAKRHQSEVKNTLGKSALSSQCKTVF